MAQERLQKILARAGLGSRRACEEFILQGRVQVDGRTITELGSRADPETQRITVDGEPVRVERTVHYLLYKPRGFICSLKPEGGRPSAVALIPDPRRLFTVGRLDEDSEGLIIVTNDGALTQRLTHPSFGVPKEYRVLVEGPVDHGAVARLRSGVYLAEGRTAPAEVRLASQGRRAELTVCIREGLNRQVRRMFAAVGLAVRRLVRVRIGPLTVGELGPGRYRRLSEAEVRTLLSGAEAGPSPVAASGAGRPIPDRHPRPPESRRPFAKGERFGGRRERDEERGHRGRHGSRRQDRRGRPGGERPDRNDDRDGRRGDRQGPPRHRGPDRDRRRDDRGGRDGGQRSDRPHRHDDGPRRQDDRRGERGDRPDRDRRGHDGRREPGRDRREDGRRKDGGSRESGPPRWYDRRRGGRGQQGGRSGRRDRRGGGHGREERGR